MCWTWLWRTACASLSRVPSERLVHLPRVTQPLTSVSKGLVPSMACPKFTESWWGRWDTFYRTLRDFTGLYTLDVFVPAKKNLQIADWAWVFSHWMKKNHPCIFQMKVDLSALSHCTQTYHPITMAVWNRRHISNNNNGWWADYLCLWASSAVRKMRRKL